MFALYARKKRRCMKHDEIIQGRVCELGNGTSKGKKAEKETK